MSCKGGLITTLVLSVALSVWLAVPAVASDEAPSSLGIVVSVAGEVMIERLDSQEAATEGFVLMGGDTIIVKAGARCSGFTPQGSDFALEGPSEYQIPTGADGGLVDNVTSWIQMQLADWVGESKRRPLTTRGARDWVTVSEAPTLILPASGGAVRYSCPELRWSAVPGVDRYVVTIAPALGDEITRMARGNTATLGELEPGAEYVWRVAPDIEGWGGRGTWREFRVLALEAEAQLDAALIGMDDLEAGVLLLSMGIHDEAIYRFDAAAASSDNSRSAKLWRSQALADCGLHREAYEDLIQVRGLD
jgi:hypothetical protein